MFFRKMVTQVQLTQNNTMSKRTYILYVIKNRNREEYNFFTHSKDTALFHAKRYPNKDLQVLRVVCVETEVEEIT